MAAFIIYLFKSAICLALFAVGVRLLLLKETFFSFNRCIILSGTALCLLLPLVTPNISYSSALQTPFIYMEDYLNLQQSSSLLKTASADKLETGGMFVTHFLFAFYIGVCALLLVRLCSACFHTRQIIRNGILERHNGLYLIITRHEVPPMSFGRYIIISKSHYESDIDAIMAHEAAHIAHRHTVDVLAFELLCIFQWFNPAIWFLRGSLKAIHEYQADERAAVKCDTETYQLTLLRLSAGKIGLSPANSFNSINLKKRITMMNKKKSNTGAKAKTALFVPLLTLAAFAFAQHENPYPPAILQTDSVEAHKDSILSNRKVEVADHILPHEITKSVPDSIQFLTAQIEYLQSELQKPTLDERKRKEYAAMADFLEKRMAEIKGGK